MLLRVSAAALLHVPAVALVLVQAVALADVLALAVAVVQTHAQVLVLAYVAEIAAEAVCLHVLQLAATELNNLVSKGAYICLAF